MTDSPDHLVQEAEKILTNKSKDACREWLAEIKPNEGVLLRQERMKSAIMVSVYLLERAKVSQDHRRLLDSMVHYYKCLKKKVSNYAYTIRYFSQKDFECQYLLRMLLAPDLKQPSIELYLKSRQTILNNAINSKRKEELSGVVGSLEDWFSIVSFVYPSVNPKQLLEKFTHIVKNHYVEIKKDQNASLNGAEMLHVIDKLHEFYPNNFVRQQINKSPSKVGSQKRTVTESFDESPSQLTSQRQKKMQTILDEKYNKIVKEMTEEVDELRKALLKEQDRVVRLTEREKFFMSFIRQTKSEVFELAQHMLEMRKEPPQLTKLLDRFEKYEMETEKKESPEMVHLNNKRDQLKLIEQIMQEELDGKLADLPHAT